MINSSVTDEEEVTVEEEVEEKEDEIIEVQRNADVEEDFEDERRALEAEIKALKVSAEERSRHKGLESLIPDVIMEKLNTEAVLLKTEPLHLKTEMREEEEKNHDEMELENRVSRKKLFF